MSGRRGAHHRGSYARRARRLVARAKSDPTTRCWVDGLTLAQHPSHHDGRPPFWTAGHERDGDPTSPLHPEASVCNFRRGAILRNTGRSPGRNPHAVRIMPNDVASPPPVDATADGVGVSVFCGDGDGSDTPPDGVSLTLRTSRVT